MHIVEGVLLCSSLSPPTPNTVPRDDLLLILVFYSAYSRLSENHPPGTRAGPSISMENSKNPSEGVLNCYVFKSRLQEYAQKMSFPTPVYETTKEGPSHEPSFKSTVTLKNVSYDSLPGFFNRKAAEQSAAEVALMELAKAGEVNQSISVPIHATGLCKNLLQEYAQKMNYAIPSYECTKDDSPSRAALFLCTVDVGGIKYIGASARTKKEAEIKAARTALLAIQSCSSEPAPRNTQLTVVPCKKRSVESNIKTEPDRNLPKAKKRRFNKKKSGTESPAAGNPDVSTDALNLVMWPSVLTYMPPGIPPDQQPNVNSSDGSRAQSTTKLNPPGFPQHPYMTNAVQPPLMIPPGQLSCMKPHNGSMTPGPPSQQNFPWLPLDPYTAHAAQRPAAILQDHHLSTLSGNGSMTEGSISQLNLAKSQDLRPPPNANSSDGLKPNC
ncbi:hypothetical protein MLD38_036317 [Melastoma candidum]|uniref:Uncharacterized protein n=2 Tax=Melastoma candidum TaxID=119954 RepID=A0ACB9LIN7_9MYRT|nr:hypothetical protein MLD38_036317 [Melastoma candidum]